MVPPSFTTLQMHSSQRKEKKKHFLCVERCKQVWKQAHGEKEGGRRRWRDEERKEEEVMYAMLQLRLWGLGCGSFMWQKHINHSYSLTGPLQHTHLQTCMSTHASVPPPCCHIHTAARSSVPQTCPTITPPCSRPSRQTITSSILYISVSIHPSIRPSISLSITAALISTGDCFTSAQICFLFCFSFFSALGSRWKRTQSQHHNQRKNKWRVKCYINCETTPKQNKKQ